MNPSSKLKTPIGLLAFMLASAACALAQAEINPDHFPDPDQPTLTAKKVAPLSTSSKMVAVGKSSVVTTQQTATQSGSTAHASVHPSAANRVRHTSGTPKRVARQESDTNNKKLVIEARHHAAP